MWYLDSRGSTEVGIGLEAGTRRVSSSQGRVCKAARWYIRATSSSKSGWFSVRTGLLLVQALSLGGSWLSLVY